MFVQVPLPVVASGSGFARTEMPSLLKGTYSTARTVLMSSYVHSFCLYYGLCVQLLYFSLSSSLSCSLSFFLSLSHLLSLSHSLILSLSLSLSLSLYLSLSLSLTAYFFFTLSVFFISLPNKKFLQFFKHVFFLFFLGVKVSERASNFGGEKCT